jgi:hypothetical protein
MAPPMRSGVRTSGRFYNREIVDCEHGSRSDGSRELPRPDPKTRANNAGLPIMVGASTFRSNLLRRPQPLRSILRTALSLRSPSASPCGDGGMEIRHSCHCLKSSTAAECRPFCVNVTTPVIATVLLGNVDSTAERKMNTRRPSTGRAPRRKAQKAHSVQP